MVKPDKNLTLALAYSYLLSAMQSVAPIPGGRGPARAPLAHILQQAMRAAAGQADSMEQLYRVDEIGILMRTVNQSGLNFRTFVDDVNSNLQALNDACRDIAQGNHTLSQCCEDTENNLQQTAASVEQLTATIKSNADATLQASHFTQDVNRAVNSGEEGLC